MIELQNVRPFFEDKPEVLGEILGWFPPDRQVMVVSDHGFHGPRPGGAKGTAEHSEWGVCVVRSPLYEAGAEFDQSKYIGSVKGYYTSPDGNMLSLPFNSSTPVLCAPPPLEPGSSSPWGRCSTSCWPAGRRFKATRRSRRSGGWSRKRCGHRIKSVRRSTGIWRRSA